MERDLFTLNPKPRGLNKRVFWEVINELPDGTIIKITPFTAYLRQQGCTSSESTIERYIRWTKTWFAPTMFKSLGKGRYILVKDGTGEGMEKNST